MDRIVVLVEYGGGMFDGVHGVITMKVPENFDLSSLGHPIGKASEYREPRLARALADHLKASGAEELEVEWIILQ